MSGNNLAITILILAIFAVACDDKPQATTGPPPGLRAISVRIDGPTQVTPPEEVQFTASQTWSDGSTRDVTASAQWTSSNPAVLSVSAGLTKALAGGEVGLTVQVGPLTSQPRAVRVVPSIPEWNGTYRLTVGGTECSGSMPISIELRQRTYTPFVRQNGLTLTVEAQPGFIVGQILNPQVRFSFSRFFPSRVAERASATEMLPGGFQFVSYRRAAYGGGPEGFIEVLPNSDWLVITGEAITTLSPSGFAGTLNGAISRYRTPRNQTSRRLLLVLVTGSRLSGSSTRGPRLEGALPRALFLLLLAAAGCSSVLGVEPPRVRTHRTTVAGALVQALHVELERSAPVRVEYWTDDGRRLVVEANAAATHRILLTRLRADRTYFYRIVGTDAEGVFTTEVLPPDLVRVRLKASGSPTTPLVLLHLYDPYGFSGYVAVNGEGDIVWYWRTVDMALGAVRRANGHSVFMDLGRGLVELRPDGSVVHELAQDREDREQHHDVIGTPNGSVLFLAFDRRQHAGKVLKGEAIWEWWPETGSAMKRWSSWDHLSPESDRGPRSGDEWLHANSLALGPRGNVLVSFRLLNQVLSISPTSSASSGGLAA